LIKFKRLTQTAQLPKRATDGAAGFDLHYDGDSLELFPGQQQIFKTNIAVELGPDNVGIIKPRSGWAAKYGIAVQAGVIDSDYRGSIQVILINLGDRPVQIYHGDRIAQMIVTTFVGESCEIDNLHATDRGASGFGSTGVK
jgi:dUTP pyrophosphatase